MLRETIVVARLHVRGMPVLLTRHAVDRYIARICPHLRFAEGRDQLVRLLKSVGSWQRHKPNYLLTRPDGSEPEPADQWLMLGGDIAFPIREDCAVTCIPRGGVSEATRERRKEGRRRHRDRTGLPRRSLRKARARLGEDER